MKTFLVNYRHDGEQFALELQATSADDAKMRLSNLVFGQVRGEVMTNLPSSTGVLARVICSLRNSLAS